MEYIPLENVLEPEQKYVLNYAQEFGKEIRAVRHDISTNTCFEKADLIGWNPNQVVKAVFLYNGGGFYGFVAPEIGTLSNPLKFNDSLIKRIFGNDKKKRKELMDLKPGSYTPIGMDSGTCTPFFPDHYFSEGDGFIGSLKKVFVYDYSELNDKKVDISIGGYGDEAHKTSVHLNYGDIYGCLDWRFSGEIEKFTF